MSDDPLELTPTAFTRLLTRLDDEALAHFIADLYAACGSETTVDGTVVILESESEEPTRLLVHAADRSWLARLVGRTAPPDPVEAMGLVLGYRASRASVPDRVTDASDLYDRLLFGVDRSTCEALCREHFDRPIEPAPEPPEGDRLGTLTAFARPTRPSVVIGVAILALLVLGVLFTALPSEMSDPPGDALGNPTEFATPVGGVLTPASEGSSEGASATQPERSASRSITWNHSAHLRARPTCNRSRGEVIEVFVAALRLDGRNGTTGYDTALRFSVARTNTTRRYVESLLQEPRFAPLFTFERARLGDPVVIRDTTTGSDDSGRVVVLQEVTVVMNASSRTFDFVMRKRLGGPRPGCWQVRSLRTATPVYE